MMNKDIYYYYYCWEANPLSGETRIQCVDGRIARLLGALVLLDYDQRNWNFHRLEDLKNELFTFTRTTIHECALEATKDSDPLIVAVGKTFLVKTLEEIELIGELDQETERKNGLKTPK